MCLVIICEVIVCLEINCLVIVFAVIVVVVCDRDGQALELQANRPPVPRAVVLASLPDPRTLEWSHVLTNNQAPICLAALERCLDQQAGSEKAEAAPAAR